MTAFASITQCAEQLRNGDLSSRELAQAYLDRIERLDPGINSYITRTADAAFTAADQADKLLKTGSGTLLTGIPLAHKDLFCTQGVLTTCASKMLANFAAPYDATVVEKLAAAGIVMLGKTNMDEFAMGSSNENSHFGAVSNPWDSDLVPGGSSGGSAAAVAAGLCVAATGTDTGGSIRQPAAFCGVTGMKPTYGRVSRFGMVAFASSLDQAGVFAHNATDVALVLAHMQGFDSRDSTSAEHTDPWLEQCKTQVPAVTSAHKGTIGLPKEYFAGLEVGSAELAAARSELEALGYRCVDISLPHTAAATPAYYVLSGAEASTNLSRYDGVRFGHRADNVSTLEELYQRSRSEGFGSEVKRRILTGTYALSVGYFDAYYVKAQQVRRLIQNDFLAAFKDVDLILAPTTPGVAFAKNSVQDPVSMYQQDLYTIGASLAGLPAMSLPCGTHQGLPLGMQLIAPHFHEQPLLECAMAFQERTQWHHQHPEL